MLGKCSRVLKAVTMVSSDEEMSQSDTDGIQVDSSVSALDESRPGKRAAEDAAGAIKKALKIDAHSNEASARTHSSAASSALDESRTGKRVAEDAAGGTKKKGLHAYFNYSQEKHRSVSCPLVSL